MATRTTSTETEVTLKNGRTRKTKVVVTEEVAPAAAASAEPTTIGGLAAQTVHEAIDVVERGVAVGQKVKGFFDLFSAFTKSK